MIRFTILLILLAFATKAAAQDCTASMQGPDALWASVPIDSAQPGAPLKTLGHLRCLGCGLDLSVQLAAGPAAPALRSMPIGRLSGRAWAQAVVDDPAQREGFLQSVLRSESRTSPGCTLRGRVAGIAELGGFGLIRTEIQAECASQPALLAGEFYSGYDGQCQYQLQAIWGPGFQALSPQGRYALQSLLSSVRIGR